MLNIFQNVLTTVTITAIFSGIMLSFLKDGAMKEVLRISAGLMVVIAILLPLSSVRVKSFSFSKIKKDYSQEAEQAESKNQDLTYNIVSAKISQYITDTAAKKGIKCTVHTYISYDEDNTIQVDRIEISCDQKAKENELSNLIYNECGIDKEKQVFEK